MEGISSWVAPIATAIAACMTASNLGSRVTGWGFVVFTVGSIAWTAYGIATDQTNLLWQNLFLTAVNILGIWRWLGRQARFDDGAAAAAKDSDQAAGPTLFPVSILTSARVEAQDGTSVGAALDAMARCSDGGIEYVVVGKGGIGGVGESLHAIPWKVIRVVDGTVVVRLNEPQLEQLAPIEPSHWPARPQALPASSSPSYVAGG